MKTVFRNIATFSLIVAGMMMTNSTVSAQTRESNGRSVSRPRTTVSSSQTAGTANRNNSSVSTPAKNTNSSRINKDAATVAGRNASVRSSSVSRPGSNTTSNITRPVTNNSGNVSANHWPSENKPTVSSSRNNNSNSVSRPSDLRNGANARPGTMNNNGYSNNSRPSSKGSIVTRPSSWSTPVAPPTRTRRPSDYIVSRPTMPKGYQPSASAPRITGIFGLTFGYSYYKSLDYLFDRGYEIDGYSGKTVYLRNVNEMNFFWPDAIINYSSRGYLESAELHYSTRYDDYSRYSRLYTNLCDTYGVPVSHTNSGNNIETVWYGSDSRGYVELTYRYSGGRYYTSLVYGY